MSKKNLVLLVLVIAIVCSFTAFASARDAQKLRIVNNSGKTIEKIGLKLSGNGDYVEGRDDLNDSPLRNGEFIEMSFLDSSERRQPHDLIAIYSDGTYDEWNGLDLHNVYEFGIERGGASSYRTTD